MLDTDDKPLSTIDLEIETMLDRLAALEARAPTDSERAIQEVAMDALRHRIRELSRKCTDRTCRVRVLRRAEEVAREDRH
jgi:hypothetical protein